MRVVIVDSGGANLASLQFALQRLGAGVGAGVAANVTTDHGLIRAASHVLLPGVGAAGNTMQRLAETGLDRVIPELRQPVLGICLGMQILAERSCENDTACLGLVAGSVRPLVAAPGRPVPHMGWNQLHHNGRGLFVDVPQRAHAYFVHSYVLDTADYVSASATYGESFAAALEQDNFYGTQFHPERSGATGARILQNFLALPSCNASSNPSCN